jgi:trimeric autotransporter adhesin
MKTKNMTTLHSGKSVCRSSLRLGFFLTFALACFAFSPRAQAVLPPPAPDGGYLNRNTAEGTNALFSLTTGDANTAVGWFSLKTNAGGSFNTAVGAGTLTLNTGNRNTAVGAAALFLNTSGSENTANGTLALFNNASGGGNTAIGDSALFSNQIGSSNTATGVNALFSNTGSINDPSFGSNNTATGVNALFSNTRGFRNTAIGVNALSTNFDNNDNTAVGVDALSSNRQSENTAVGAGALKAAQFAAGNTAVGFRALANNQSNANTAVGNGALFNNSSGLLNTALGTNAGFNVTTARNVNCIGHIGQNVNFSTWISNIYGTATVSGTTLPVVVSDVGQLGTAGSSARFKKEVKPMDRASESILAFKPVTFRYRSDKGNAPQFGLIAEEVARVNPDLVVRDKNGEIYAVRYDAVNAMLLNEFLKEHRKVEELTKDFQATVAQLTARLDEQAAQIQKVSAQLEASKPAPQVVNNP